MKPQKIHRKKKTSLNNSLPIVISLIEKDFGFDVSKIKVFSITELKAELTNYISILLNQDFAMLINALYRIDVDEEKVKLAMATDGNLPEALAQLIIERELKKVISRKSYNTSK